jgi:hypothetical protein
MKGPSKKNTVFIKRGLTPVEQRHVADTLASNKERWERLFALNKWKPQPEEKSKKKLHKTT